MRIFRRRSALFGLVSVVAIVVVAMGAGWYLSGIIGCRGFEVHQLGKPSDVEVLSVTDSQITLQATAAKDECGSQKDDLDKPGIWGLTWSDGYGHVGDVRSINAADDRVVREFTAFDGAPAPGTEALLTHPFPASPSRALGIPFVDVTFDSPLGDFAAWRTDGVRSTWVIFVHGKGAKRTEAMRLLKTVHQLGYPGLIINYRNDRGVPRDRSGRYQYDKTEWVDVEAAIRFAIDSGARDVVLVGYSMGGGIVASFLYQSELAGTVRGAILDAPMLDFGATVDFGIEQFGVPSFLAGYPRWFAGLRYGIDWAAIDYVSRADELRTPLLLIHGVDDDLVPVTIGDEFAARRPDLVTYERFDGAHHVTSWNVDPERYERVVTDFLRAVTP